jgi:CubicO group peptidase (beta-lactamase class C family)
MKPTRWTLRRGAAWVLAMAMACPIGTAVAAPADTRTVAQVVVEAERQGLTGEVLVAGPEGVSFEAALGGGTVGRVWRWASVSKQVTAVLALQEVEAGRLQLDAPVAPLLALELAPVLATTRQMPADVTARQLLQHTSGLRPLPDEFFSRPGGMAAHREAALAHCTQAPEAPAGTRFAYLACDTWVMQDVLERVSGRSIEALLAERLGQPLGWRQVRWSGGEGPLPNPATYGAGAALMGTARELLAFDQALMQGRLVSAASRAELWRGEPRWGYAALGTWSFEAPLAGCQQPVAIVERRGLLGALQVRNILVPAEGLAVIVFSEQEGLDFGEIWQGRGLAHDLLSAAACTRSAG